MAALFTLLSLRIFTFLVRKRLPPPIRGANKEKPQTRGAMREFAPEGERRASRNRLEYKEEQWSGGEVDFYLCFDVTQQKLDVTR